jgi:HAD superfamily hydrolase (TIGR01509 family)
MAELGAPDAIVFDLDGTLVDTVGTRIAAWLRTFQEQGIPAAEPQVAALIGSDGRRLAHVVATAAGRPIDDAQAEVIDRRSGELYSELNQDPRPLPGARELLLALDRQGIRWAIATSSRPEQVGASVDSLRLPKRPAIIDGSHVANAKPAPDLLLHAARELGVAPSRTWYVGDSVWDMQAARAAGMHAVGVATGAATIQDLEHAGASQTVTDLGKLARPLSGAAVVRVERYGPGEEATDFSPGDFILTHRHNPISRLISAGQQRRFRGPDAMYAHWSHCALLVDQDGALVEAESTGVRRGPISRYRADEYHLVRLGPEFEPAARERSVAYANAQVGQSFGYLALVGASIYLLFGWPLRVMRGDHQICSGLVVHALQAGGLLADVDAQTTLPADLAKMFGARP